MPWQNLARHRKKQEQAVKQRRYTEPEIVAMYFLRLPRPLRSLLRFLEAPKARLNESRLKFNSTN